MSNKNNNEAAAAKHANGEADVAKKAAATPDELGLDAVLREKLAETEAALAALVVEKDEALGKVAELELEKEAIAAELESVKAEKLAADAAIKSLMGKLAEQVNDQPVSSLSIGKEKVSIPQETITIDERTWKAIKPAFNHNGQDYSTALVIAGMPEIVAAVVAIEGQRIFEEVIN